MADESRHRVAEDQVVQMAIQMEELGRDFYQALGGASSDPRVLQLCHRLATEENKHRDTFRRLHSELAAQGKSVILSDEHIADARRRLKEHIVPTAETIRQVACGGNVIEALTMAVRMEAEAVRFFTHLAEQLPADNDIEAIIAEERTHLRLLSAMRCGVAAGP